MVGAKSAIRCKALLLLLYNWLTAVYSQYKVVPKDRNTRDNLPWIIGNGDPMHEMFIPPLHMGTARVKQKEEASSRIIVKE